jgi:hypothetical protein
LPIRAYPDGGVVIDTQTKKVVAKIRISEKLIEIDFRNGKPVRPATGRLLSRYIRAKRAAKSNALTKLTGFATPFPAMSNAVP